MGTILIRIIQIGAILCASCFGFALVRKAKAHPEMISKKSTMGLGAVIGGTMFFDALGIGGNAPQTALFKIFKLVPDRLIPGTLNTCTLIPCTIETLLFVTLVKVDPITLVCLIIAVAGGAALGAKYVSHFPVKPIQIILGCALIIVAIIMTCRQIGLWPAGGNAIGIYGWKLFASIAIFFVFGLCAAAGIGVYAPMMAVCYAMGMNPRSAFPIMFGGYTFLMPAAGFRFLKEGALDMKANLVGQIAGTIGVILAVFLVKELPLYVLTWIVICVLLYTSVMMFFSAFKKKKEEIIDENEEGHLNVTK
ncbi:MAG: sulfite exporter TauE/SafE family protein [Oscillospiraceae bacterium]